MPRKPSAPVQEESLLDLLDEIEHGPPACIHRFAVGAKTGHAWVCDTDPASPYYMEWVHSDPKCRRPADPGRHKETPPTMGWSRELQKDVPL